MNTPQRPELAVALDLAPHPEGGWFREYWRSDTELTRADGATRTSGTAIYYLLGAGDRSRWHTVTSTEIWCWHSGGPLTLALGGDAATPESAPSIITLGPDLASGQQPAAVVPTGVWQSAAPTADTEVLVSCFVSPGFDFDDFRLIESDG